MMKPLIIYVKQSYSLLRGGFNLQQTTPFVSCESLATIIDLNNNELQQQNDEQPLKPSLLCACPISIEILMLLSLKQLPFDVKLCNANKMLPEELCYRMIHQLPVLIDPNNGDQILEYRMDIVDYIERKYPTKTFEFNFSFDNHCNDNQHQLNWKLITVIHMVNRRFYHYIQQQTRSPSRFMLNDLAAIRQQLLNGLGELNRVLTLFGTRYAMTDEQPTMIDCHMMPRLHQIRVILKQMDGIEIPNGLRCLWQYLNETYEWNIFRRWCPSDQEIQIHWLLKMNNSSQRQFRMKLMQLIRSSPTYSFDCPVYENQVTKL